MRDSTRAEALVHSSGLPPRIELDTIDDVHVATREAWLQRDLESVDAMSDMVPDVGAPGLLAPLLKDPYDHWAHRVRLGLFALQAYRAREYELPTSDISLVMYEVDGQRHIMYVNWKAGFEGTIGQRVNLDQFNRVIYSTVPIHPWRHLTDTSILWPQCGVGMAKVTARWRPEMPEQVRLLKKMWEIAIGNDGDGRSSFKPCQVCGCVEVGSEITTTCPLCTCSWHRECVAGVLSDWAMFTDNWDTSEVELPAVFSDVCALCYAFTMQAFPVLGLREYQKEEIDNEQAIVI